LVLAVCCFRFIRVRYYIIDKKMSSERQIQLSKVLHEHSRKILDPAERSVQILEDEKVLKLADQFKSSVHDVYIEAMHSGIYPHRYIRNRESITLDEQIRLAKSQVAIVGSGGLGGHLILTLARVGIGHIIVVDHDVFDETNLNRQAISSKETIGLSKSDSAVHMVESINPGVKVIPSRVKIDPSNASEILNGSNVVVDALDNITDRFVLENAAGKLKIPLVHGAVAGFEGQVMTIFPEDQGLKSIYGSDGAKKNKTKSPEAILGVPAIAPCFIATLQAMEVIKIILKRGKLFRNTMVHVDLETGEFNKFTLS